MTCYTTLTATSALPVQPPAQHVPHTVVQRAARGEPSLRSAAALMAVCACACFAGWAIGVAAALIAAAAGYVVLAALVADRFTGSRRRMSQFSNMEAAGVECVGFAARDGRARLAGWYLDAADARAALVFVHGKDSCRGDELKSPTLALATACNAAGLAVLMIDLRGHGGSSAARLSFGANERHDVLGAVDWLRAQGHARIGVLGASMGAATSLLAAADEPAIAAVVADSAFADFGAMIDRQYRKLSRMPRCLLPGALLLARLATGVQLQAVRPLQAAATLRDRPLLVVHAAGDSFIPAGDARELAAAAGAELWITGASRHLGWYAAEPDAYTDRVVGFFVHQLLRPAVGPGGRDEQRLGNVGVSARLQSDE